MFAIGTAKVTYTRLEPFVRTAAQHILQFTLVPYRRFYLVSRNGEETMHDLSTFFMNCSLLRAEIEHEKQVFQQENTSKFSEKSFEKHIQKKYASDFLRLAEARLGLTNQKMHKIYK